MMILIAALMGLYQLQAEKAKYNGQDLILSESVEMTHPIGRLSANRAVLHHFKMDHQKPFQTLSLDGKVRVHAVTADRDLFLSAEHADGKIDAGILMGFQNFRCQGDVEISTSDGFCAKGGEAQYYCMANRGKMIELTPHPIYHECTLLHERDHLQAKKIRFEMEQKKITCEQPHGEIFSCWKKNSSVFFTADRLNWQQDLVLDGNVSLLNVEQSISFHSNRITLALTPEERELTQIASQGPTQIDFLKAKASLNCQGPLCLDPAVRILKTTEPLAFSDPRIHLEAESGWLTYQEADHCIRPEAVYCDRSVRLISSVIQEQECFALADQLVYFPTSHTIILSSRPPNRVLFWQSDGNMTLSSPEVHVRLDPKTHKETVQGIGDVHFRFTVQEENMIENIFSKYL